MLFIKIQITVFIILFEHWQKTALLVFSVLVCVSAKTKLFVQLAYNGWRLGVVADFSVIV